MLLLGCCEGRGGVKKGKSPLLAGHDVDEQTQLWSGDPHLSVLLVWLHLPLGLSSFC